MKINLRESLNKIDLATDNKYDLRNTYDSSNISNDKKKKLAESLNNNASAKQIYGILNDESLTEASYGGAYDIEDDMYFTKEELVEFADEVCELLHEKFGYDYETVEVGMESTTELYLRIQDIHGVEEESTFRIDMRKIRKPSDLFKYAKPIAGRLAEKFEEEYQYYDFNESLNESNKSVIIGTMTLDHEIPNWTNYAESPKYDENVTALPSTSSVTIYPYNSKELGHSAYWGFKAIDADGNKDFARMNNYIYGLGKYLDGYKGMTLKLNSNWEWSDKYPYLIFKGKNMFEDLTEDTVKTKSGKWVNKGDTGKTHGKFRTKKAADAQRRAMFQNGYEAESLDEARIIEPKYRDGDVVFVGDASGYHGTFLIKGDFRNIPEELYHNIRRITKYGNLDKPYYKVEYKIDSNHLFEEDYREFFEYIIPILKDVGIDVLKSEKDIEYNESLKEKLNNRDKNVFIDKIEKAESLDEIEDTIKDIRVYDLKLYSKLVHYPNDFEKAKNYILKILKNSMLKEAIDDEIDLDYESDFDEDGVEEGNTFIEDGTEWCWIERIAGPIHLDFDNWAVWSARNWDQVQYAWNNIDIETRKEAINNRDTDFFIELINSVYDEAEVAYFVVDEDTGFIDWGPVETQTEAQDFLNSKVEDYENDEEYEEVEVEEESLTESRAIRNDGDYEVTLHYDDIGDGKEYDYTLGYNEVVDYLKELAWANGDGPEDLNEDEYLEWVMDNFDELADKYELNVLNYFESEASQDEYDHIN